MEISTVFYVLIWQPNNVVPQVLWSDGTPPPFALCWSPDQTRIASWLQTALWPTRRPSAGWLSENRFLTSVKHSEVQHWPCEDKKIKKIKVWSLFLFSFRTFRINQFSRQNLRFWFSLIQTIWWSIIKHKKNIRSSPVWGKLPEMVYFVSFLVQEW